MATPNGGAHPCFITELRSVGRNSGSGHGMGRNRSGSLQHYNTTQSKGNRDAPQMAEDWGPSRPCNVGLNGPQLAEFRQRVIRRRYTPPQILVGSQAEKNRNVLVFSGYQPALPRGRLALLSLAPARPRAAGSVYAIQRLARATPAGLDLAFTHKHPWTKEMGRKPYNFGLNEPQNCRISRPES